MQKYSTFSFKALVKHILNSLLAGLQGVLAPSFSIVRSKYYYLSLLSSQRSKVRYLYDDGATQQQVACIITNEINRTVGDSQLVSLLPRRRNKVS